MYAAGTVQDTAYEDACSRRYESPAENAPVTRTGSQPVSSLIGRAAWADAVATASVFAIFADAPWNAGRQEFFRPLIYEPAQELADFGMPIRTGWIVGPSSFAEYQPHTMSYGSGVPLETVQSSCINAELAFRGRQVQSGLSLALPRR